MAAHRLGNSESVVILFEGNKVPRYVKYGGFVTKCTLYRQHREVCITCGRIGHRRDVCPTPNARVCFARGRNNPGEDHAEYCKPRCKFCGGSHVTGAGSCKNKFKTPLQIKQRQWEKQHTETLAKMAPTKMAPAPAKAAEKVTLSRRFDFPEPGANGTRQNGVASRDRSRAKPEDGTWVDVTSGGPKAERPPRPAPQVHAHPSLTNKSDVTRAAMTQKSRAPSGETAASKEPSKTPSNGGCSEQCKKETRELKATVKEMEKAMEELQTAMAAMQLTIKQQRGVIDQQRDAIRRLQEREPGIEANNNKMATDAEEEDSGIPTNNMGSTAINTTTPKIFQLTAKTRTPTRASIVAAARGLEEQHEEELESASESDEEEEDSALAISAAATNNGDRTKPLGYVGLSKKIDRVSRIIKKWGKELEGLEQRILTKCTQVVQQQQAQLIQLQTEQALERALSPETLQPLLDRSVQQYCQTQRTILHNGQQQQDQDLALER
ncbi:hypothetical protein MTO96_024765 [Rhipicephalus appendiculatus]